MSRKSLIGVVITLLIVFIFLCPALLLHAPAEWTPPLHLSTGIKPRGLCVADLDDNTYLDIVVANSFSDNVTIYYQDGTGFGVPQTLVCAGGPEAVAVGDVVGTADKDIVVVRTSVQKISIFPGTGTGFGPAIEKNCGSDPVHVDIGDLDGDGDDDIAVAETGGIVRFFYNTAAGLQNTHNLTTDSGTAKVVVVDLEGDSDNDVIAINEFKNNLTIYRRTGASWGAPTQLLTGLKPTGLAVENVMGDSHKDIVISNYDDNNVTVYEWDGGAWATPYTLGVGFGPNDVFIADVNGDLQKDIITANLGVSTITILPNEGATWGTPISEDVGNEPYALWVQDLNKDTNPDIVTTNAAGADITILYWIDNTPPVAYGIPDTFTINEDTPSNSTYIDLWQYFEDQETNDDFLTFSVENGSDNILIGSITDGRYFTVDIGTEGEHWFGSRNFTIRCTDAKLAFVEDEFTLTVEPVNDKPQLISLGGKPINDNQVFLTNVGFLAVQDELYYKTLVAFDADNDTMTFKTNISEGSVEPHPRFAIESANGSIAFQPNNEDALKQFLFFNLSVTDSKGSGNYVHVVIGIMNMNDAPEILTIGKLTAQEGMPFSYPVRVVDVDGDSILWSDDCPLFDISKDGYINLTPKTEDIGIYNFNITADDDHDGIAVQAVELSVENINDPPDIPRIAKPSNKATFYVNEAFNLSAEDCNDPDIPFGDVLTYEWNMGDGSQIFGQNQTYQYSKEGTYVVDLNVYDTALVYRNTNITLIIESEGKVPDTSLTNTEHTDDQNDVNMFKVGRGGYTVGGHDYVDIELMTTVRVGMTVEVVLKLYGEYSPDVTYEVYVTSPFIESAYEYSGSGDLPTPNTPSEIVTFVKGSYCENKNISIGQPEVLGAKNIKFTLPLSSLIGESDFHFFGVAYYKDNDTFDIDSVGDGKYKPNPYQPPPDTDDDDDGMPLWRKIAIAILFIVLVLLFMFLIVWIIIKIRSRGKDKEEEDDFQDGAQLPPGQAPPPPPPEAAPMPPPPMMEDEGELIPPDVPMDGAMFAGEEEPPPDMLEPDARPELPIGASAQDAIDGLLLPPPDAVGGGQEIEPEPEPAPAEEGGGGGKDDIFDELFTPIGDAGGAAGGGGMEVECYDCHGAISVTSDERPLVLKCPHCGTESMLP